MIITDVFGDKSERCFRCGGSWCRNEITIGGFGCENSLPNDRCLELLEDGGCTGAPYFFNLPCRLGDEWSALSWGWQAKKRCMFMNRTDCIYLPMLPYDISLDRLKVLLVFS